MQDRHQETCALYVLPAGQPAKRYPMFASLCYFIKIEISISFRWYRHCAEPGAAFARARRCALSHLLRPSHSQRRRGPKCSRVAARSETIKQIGAIESKRQRQPGRAELSSSIALTLFVDCLILVAIPNNTRCQFRNLFTSNIVELRFLTALASRARNASESPRSSQI